MHLVEYGANNQLLPSYNKDVHLHNTLSRLLLYFDHEVTSMQRPKTGAPT